MAKKLTPEARQIRERCVVDADDFDWWLSQKGWAWEGLDRGDYGCSLDDAQFLYVCESPVLWARTFLEEPEPTEDMIARFAIDDEDTVPYSFWPYQVTSADAWYQDCVHMDGAEVGKTREITVLILWAMCTAFGYSKRQPSILVGAPQQTHLDEIIMAIEEVMGVADGQIGPTPFLHRYWAKPKKHPHMMMRFIVPNVHKPKRPYIGRVYFRPAGHDGIAFRGVHVNGFAFMDEAAKVPSAVCWSEFRRAKKPGCVERNYSVPDGRRDTEYYRLTTRAVPNLAPDKKGVRLFHWPKTLMPDPFWNDERRRKYIAEYGGVDSPGYVRNVSGLHGQPEDTVFAAATLMPNVREVAEYRAIKIICEPVSNTLHLEVYRVELETTKEGNKVPHTHYIAERQLDLDDYVDVNDWKRVRMRVRDLLREFIQPPAGAGEFYLGCDLGYSCDPSEYFLFARTGLNLRQTLRVHLKGAEYPLQCEIIYCLDALFGFGQRITRIGVDLGSAGIAVVQMLQANKGDVYDGGDYVDRIFGVQFKTKTEAVDEDGNLVMQEDKDGNEKPVRQSFKHLATDLLVRRFQRHEADLPYDNEVIQYYLGHTATKSSSDEPIYDKKNDHTIDAARTALLAMVLGGDLFVEAPLVTGAMGR